MNVLGQLRQRFATALWQQVDEDPTDLLAMIRPAQDARFGDYQANCAMPLGKKLGKPPRDIARQLIDLTDVSDFCEPPEIAGPGFINLRVKQDWLTQQLNSARQDDRLGVSATDSPRTYVVDFSSPNVAKPMHVGHIRSTVIGDALCRTLRFVGHNVISDNHLGDWGTQFGMIIYGYRNFVDAAAYQTSPVKELGRIYRQVRQIMDVLDRRDALPQQTEKVTQARAAADALAGQDPGDDKSAVKKHKKSLHRAQDAVSEAERNFADLREKLASVEQDTELMELVEQHANIRTAVLDETAKLHEGDPENTRLWQQFLPKCRQDIQRIYERIDVSFDHEYGESFYHDRLSAVVHAFESAGLARESDGAMCVFLDGFATPMIIRKRDGAFLYATTDLATIAYRMETWKPDAILYVVDFRQGEHFQKLFAAAAKWGYANTELAHVSFGTVLGDDGKPFRTRSGDTVGLERLLDEAEERALAVVCESDEGKQNGPELDDATRREIARVVGIAALKYADLSQNRDSDYKFSYDKMLALNGNTATYMQYSYARVHGIFKRVGADIESLRASASASISLKHPAERALGLQLIRFSEALDETLVDYRPNQLTTYLYDLAKSYTTFFDQCSVKNAESDAIRESRLLLCDLTARTLRLGLSLLGIKVVEKM